MAVIINSPCDRRCHGYTETPCVYYSLTQIMFYFCRICVAQKRVDFS